METIRRFLREQKGNWLLTAAVFCCVPLLPEYCVPLVCLPAFCLTLRKNAVLRLRVLPVRDRAEAGYDYSYYCEE